MCITAEYLCKCGAKKVLTLRYTNVLLGFTSILFYKMFLPLSLSAPPPPLACSAPGAESNSVEEAEFFVGGAEQNFAPFGRDSAPPEFFSAFHYIFFLPLLI